YQRNADMLTPILKMFSSEYANQIAYDAIQIHGGTGFMKDFPVERMYRDARILTIYEGTSQLQVVAAIRHVLNGNASKLIESYEQEEVKAELMPLRDILKRMHAELDKAVETVKGMGNDELVDFHARRLVEIAGYTILGNLVLLDANRSEAFRKSAEVFVAYGEGMVQRHASFIAAFKPESVEFYK
ncbi:MAG: acyl-CoA dehydrogenase, partial [Bacteroidales bacterium]|nr:acyl-CoA dehydrogenase [Bacteroidales bacterium]